MVLTCAAAFGVQATRGQNRGIRIGRCDPLYMHIMESSVPPNFAP